MTELRAEDLARWQSDPVAWAEECVWCRNPESGTVGPLVLLEHQRAWLQEASKRGPDGRPAHRVVVASWPKREGKTLVVALLLAHRAACLQGQRLAVLANSVKQAQSNVYDALLGIFKDSPKLKPYLDAGEEQTEKFSLPALGNQVTCFAANFRTVQGTRFDLLAVDELHASDDHGKAFTFASQQTEAAGAQVAIASQAGAPVEGNPLWRLHKAAQGGASHILFDYRQQPAAPWAVRRAEEAKAELLPGEWAYLWQNAWGQTGIKLLSAADVEVAAMGYLEPATAEEWRRLKEAWGWAGLPVSVAVGLDRAGVSRRGDRTVWTVVGSVVRADGDRLFRVVRCAVLPTGSEAEVLAEAARTRTIFGRPSGIIFESYGCGDLVEKVQGARLETPSAQRQQQLFNRMSRLFVEGRIGFPESAGVDPRGRRPGLLKSELVSFEYDAESVLTRFGTQSGHDDSAYSLAWALEAVNERPALEALPRPSWLDDPPRPRQEKRRRVLHRITGGRLD